MSKTNQRRSERVSCSLPAVAEGPRGPIRGVCRNLSQAGMLFVGGRLPLGQQLEFRMELPVHGAVRAVGEVRHQCAHPEGAGVGIRFTRLDKEHLSRIDRYLGAD